MYSYDCTTRDKLNDLLRFLELFYTLGVVSYILYIKFGCG